MTYKTTLLEVPFSGGMLRGTIAEPMNEPATKTLVCVHGFEWPASIDQKFRLLAETLPQKGYRVIRFDYRGNGLSDGNFRDTRIATMLEDLSLVLDHVSPNAEVEIASYSISTAITSLYWQKNSSRISKILFFGAALDHSSISRFVTLKRALRTLPFAITMPALVEKLAWKFRQHAPIEKIFEKPFHKTKFSHEISSEFYRDLLDLNANPIVESMPQDMRALVHGTRDESSPRQNVTAHFDHECTVKDGDHHLEQARFIEQWLPFVQTFLGV
ncbi:MAG: alpha/beta fold hydrolase [Patescibacteria group bacterium]